MLFQDETSDYFPMKHSDGSLHFSMCGKTIKTMSGEFTFIVSFGRDISVQAEEEGTDNDGRHEIVIPWKDLKKYGIRSFVTSGGQGNTEEDAAKRGRSSLSIADA